MHEIRFLFIASLVACEILKKNNLDNCHLNNNEIISSLISYKKDVEQ